MPELRVRPVQTRVVTRKGHDYIEFGVRVPRQAVEASALDPEGVAAEVAHSWAQQLRHELGLPAASGPRLYSPRARALGDATSVAGAIPRAAELGAGPFGDATFVVGSAQGR